MHEFYAIFIEKNLNIASEMEILLKADKKTLIILHKLYG